jgi:hypothetical protein
MVFHIDYLGEQLRFGGFRHLSLHGLQISKDL